MNKTFFILFFALTTSAWSMDIVREVPLVDGRTILADTNGLTLYTFDLDESGVSNCHGGCLSVWPPFLVADGTEVTAPFGLIVRPSGQLQVTFNDLPLYFFVGDSKEGDILGDNLNGVWHIIVTEGE